jgi:dTMP kinase
MNKRGKLFSFEGLDKSGKTTLLNNLRLELEKEGQGDKYKFYCDPDYNLLDGKLREWLLRGNKLNDEAELFMFLAARSLLAEKIKQDLEAGYTVFCDRWADSTLVYQGYLKKWYDRIPRNLFNEMNRIATLSTRLNEDDDFRGLVPDVTFFIDVLPEECRNRLVKEKSTNYDIRLSAGVNELRKLRDGYMLLLKNDKLNRFIYIDGNKSEEDVYGEIVSYLIKKGVVNK